MIFVNLQAQATPKHLLETLCLKHPHHVTMVNKTADSVAFANTPIMMVVQIIVSEVVIAV
jgi:hypothetical protein